jgi:mono/diheme cytochrome c family protein
MNPARVVLYYCKAARHSAYRADQGRLMPAQDDSSAWELRSNGRGGLFWGTLVLLATLPACDIERRKSNAELGLNPQQAAGRQIYDHHCDRCHEPYSMRGKKGPGLKGVFKNKYLSLSGLPANDERVTDIIRLGRNEMPAYSQTLNAQDLEDLLAYLHTL